MNFNSDEYAPYYCGYVEKSSHYDSIVDGLKHQQEEIQYFF